jgi:hypothetical protein
MYQITSNDGITTVKDGIRYFIPRDPENGDYQAFLEWVAEGNTPTEWVYEQ